MADADARPRVQLFTDGACLGNPGPGGWAFILRDLDTDNEIEQSAGQPDTTNNRMELLAVIHGLEALSKPSHVTLVGDSEYVLKGLTEWLPDWKARNWRKKDRKPVMNAELWQHLDELLQTHTVEVEWTRGHSGHPENERCDTLAVAEATLIQDAQRL
jgi:ribonuclease HI